MLTNIRLAWTVERKKILAITGVLSAILIILLASSTWIFFAIQQDIYASVNENWQKADEYYNLLVKPTEASEIISFEEVDPSTLQSILDIKRQQADLAGEIHNDLANLQSPENPISFNFYERTKNLLELEQQTAQATVTYLDLKYCLVEKSSALTALSQTFLDTFQKLDVAENTEQIKSILQDSADRSKQLAEVTRTVSNCFQDAGNSALEEAEQNLEPLLKTYSEYQAAVKEFIDGVNNLQVEQTENALRKIKTSQPNALDLQRFDTFIKSGLETGYNSLANKQEILKITHQSLRQTYLEIRLRTLFK